MTLLKAPPPLTSTPDSSIARRRTFSDANRKKTTSTNFDSMKELYIEFPPTPKTSETIKRPYLEGSRPTPKTSEAAKRPYIEGFSSMPKTSEAIKKPYIEGFTPLPKTSEAVKKPSMIQSPFSPSFAVPGVPGDKYYKF